MIMCIRQLISNNSIDYGELTKQTDEYLKRLFPVCRSITGDGVRKTLDILNEIVEFDTIEIPTGKQCYDWNVPEEWNVEEAYVDDASGKRIIDFKNNNLHVVSYSTPVDKVVGYSELMDHLHTLPEIPDAIPYRTSYYKKDWGFCISQNQFDSLSKTANYRVVIKSSLKNGYLSLGECLIKGTSRSEFLISTYCCHPSLANDNLSGQVLWAMLLREMKKMDTIHSYRFVILPETIGAIAYLAQNEEAMKKINGGYIPTTVAGPGKFGYKMTYQGDSDIDRVVMLTFNELGIDFIKYPFDINGSDERQYSSQAFRIPMGTICKDKYYEYDYYHTSLDNLSFINAEALIKTLELYLLCFEKIETK